MTLVKDRPWVSDFLMMAVDRFCSMLTCLLYFKDIVLDTFICHMDLYMSVSMIDVYMIVSMIDVYIIVSMIDVYMIVSMIDVYMENIRLPRNYTKRTTVTNFWPVVAKKLCCDKKSK
ncbi:hypothetical protein MAR_001030 [Mya arenaria]|uniref:Uncharacterized protein n=1 Tax=Mya arenaria TaxID=6604 RepID=A0ABY7FAJ2_MYAAR|nr:hypothetical protein MAR_001030 [Mya arenaria]